MSFIKIKKNTRGTSFIELLLYTGIFLILTPILLNVAINSLRTGRLYNIEKGVNSDSQFSAERMYDLIVNAKKINAADSRFNDPVGRLSIIRNDGASAIIELNSTTQAIEVTEGGVKSNLTSKANRFEQLYFEKIADSVNDPDIILGVNMRIKSAGLEATSIEQNYILSANLENGDYDGDGCSDYTDKFPKHSQCCGDAEVDGICDELDNCVLAYNPFQEDYDNDLIGDSCDVSAFGGDSMTGQQSNSQSAYNCSPDAQLLSLLNQEPPLKSSDLKQILLSSSPIPPSVLQELINDQTLLSPGHFQQVFTANVKFTPEIRNAINAMEEGYVNKYQLLKTDNEAEKIAWYNQDNNEYTNYTITLLTDAGEGETWKNRIDYSNADYPLCSTPNTKKTDIFTMDVQNGADTVTVITRNDAFSVTSILSPESPYIEDSNGFSIELNKHEGNSYIFLVSSSNCTKKLNSIEYNFGSGANVYNPNASEQNYSTRRYTAYCEGGCDSQCGDGGTGIGITNSLTDKCYQQDNSLPEWCSHWYTFQDDDNKSPAYIGGTQIGNGSVYWEKKFQSILTQVQLLNLKSITIAGQVAYQNITQFFCDTLQTSCPMNGTLSGIQNVELYDQVAKQWKVIGPMNVNSADSNQQNFEITYAGSDIRNFVNNKNEIQARIGFRWNGTPPDNSSNAPSFMLIDFLTAHLKW